MKPWEILKVSYNITFKEINFNYSSKYLTMFFNSIYERMNFERKLTFDFEILDFKILNEKIINEWEKPYKNC